MLKVSIFSVLTAAFLSIQASPSIAESVYWNYGIGAIQTGWSEQNKGPMGLKTHIVGIGPDDATRELQECIIDATVKAGKSTWNPLDRHIEDRSMILEKLATGNSPATKETYDAEVKKQSDATGQMMGAILSLYQASVARCMTGKQYDPNSIRLGLVTRVCASWLDTVEECKEPRNPVSRKQDPATGRFAKLQDWLAANGLNPPVNEMIQLVPPGEQSAKISPDLRDRTYFPALSSEQAELYFEAGVERLRRNGWKYDYSGPRVSGIDQSIAIALIDAISNPALSVVGLKNDGRKLQNASSEIIRERIRECARFRGMIGYKDIATCAGVVNEADVIRNCLGEGGCRPKLSKEIRGFALTITNADGQLTLSSPLPRILAAVPASQQYAAAKACAEGSETNADFGICFAESQLLDGRSKQALQCAREMDRAKQLDCMLDVIGGTGAAKAKCVLAAKDNAARAMCLLSTDAPEEVAEAIECARRPGATYESIGACVLSKNIPGDAGRLAECAGSAGGNAAGAAICLAGDGLTPEQRILLQCAVQSADPSSYGVCVGGQLALKEFANCKDENFAEDSCFGENNEIRKFVRSIGLGDINEDTIVAQILDKQLDLIKFNVSAAEGAIEGLGKFGEEAAKFLGDVIDDGLGLLPEIPRDGCDALPGDAGALCRGEKPGWVPEFPTISLLTAPDVFLSELTGVSVTDIDSSKIKLTVATDGTISLDDGEHFVSFGKEQDTRSSQVLQQVAESLNGTSWKRDTPSSGDQGAKIFTFKPDTAESALDSPIARGLNLKVTNFDKLKDIGFSSRDIERIRQFQD